MPTFTNTKGGLCPFCPVIFTICLNFLRFLVKKVGKKPVFVNESGQKFLRKSGKMGQKWAKIALFRVFLGYFRVLFIFVVKNPLFFLISCDKKI